jgi:hypothetical protein
MSLLTRGDTGRDRSSFCPGMRSRVSLWSPVNEVGVWLCGDFRNDTDTVLTGVSGQLARFQKIGIVTVLLVLARVGLQPWQDVFPSPLSCSTSFQVFLLNCLLCIEKVRDKDKNYILITHRSSLLLLNPDYYTLRTNVGNIWKVWY